jgi:hypothetical protein
MSKYDGLSEYLKQQAGKRVTLSFEQVEDIIAVLDAMSNKPIAVRRTLSRRSHHHSPVAPGRG